MMEYILPTIGCTLVGAVGYYFYAKSNTIDAKRNVKKGIYGTKLTEGLISEKDIVENYDKKMSELWGGPPPELFPGCFKTWPSKYNNAGRGKVALVTGGAAGIGFYVSKMLANNGFEIIWGYRKGLEYEVSGAKKAILNAVPTAKITILEAPLDLGSFKSVKAFANECRKKYKCVDVLCLNAGRGGSNGDPKQTTEDGHESIVQINALSHFLLTKELYPLLKQSKNARVVSQSSGARKIVNAEWEVPKRVKTGDLSADVPHKGGYNAFAQYQLSKATNCFFTLALNKHLAEAGVNNITGIVCEPGYGSTGVNIQHNLTHSFLFLPDKLLPTKWTHTLLGQHAADASLPMGLACIHPDATRDSFFTPRNGMKGEAILNTQTTLRSQDDAEKDPMNTEQTFWGKGGVEQCRDGFWNAAVKATGVKTWEF